LKLPILKGKDVVKILEKFGFKIDRRKGSHLLMKKEKSSPVDPPRTVIVPMHQEVARGTLRHIINKAGMTRDEFLASC
jgi:predicted RNA binding protein YcfA (HicA-like mRNA interferase family)